MASAISFINSVRKMGGKAGRNSKWKQQPVKLTGDKKMAEQTPTIEKTNDYNYYPSKEVEKSGGWGKNRGWNKKNNSWNNDKSQNSKLTGDKKITEEITPVEPEGNKYNTYSPKETDSKSNWNRRGGRRNGYRTPQQPTKIVGDKKIAEQGVSSDAPSSPSNKYNTYSPKETNTGSGWNGRNGWGKRNWKGTGSSQPVKLTGDKKIAEQSVSTDTPSVISSNKDIPTSAGEGKNTSPTQGAQTKENATIPQEANVPSVETAASTEKVMDATVAGNKGVTSAGDTPGWGKVAKTVVGGLGLSAGVIALVSMNGGKQSNAQLYNPNGPASYGPY